MFVTDADGKLTPEGIEHLVSKRTDIHYPRPKALSLTQATEVGTVYTSEELRAIRKTAIPKPVPKRRRRVAA